MTTPGVGPVVALTYRATVDVPARFRKSKAVGAVFGLTCAKYQSGEVDRNGRISRCEDEMMRVMLYEAAQSLLRSKKWSWFKAWGDADRQAPRDGLTAPSTAGPGNRPQQRMKTVQHLTVDDQEATCRGGQRRSRSAHFSCRLSRSFKRSETGIPSLAADCE